MWRGRGDTALRLDYNQGVARPPRVHWIRSIAAIGSSACLVALAPRPAAAQDAFEIQVYDSETAAPARIGVELHVNAVAIGGASPGPSGEAPTDRVGHVTL